MIRVHVEAVGLRGPGLAGWAASAPVLGGEAPYLPAPVVVPAAALLPAELLTRARHVGALTRTASGAATLLQLPGDDPVQNVATTARVRTQWPELCIVARARDAGHAGELYRAGATDAVPETLESSLQLSEAVLVDLGVAMGPVIASIHERRAELREEIMSLAPELDHTPPLKRRQLRDAIAKAEETAAD